MGISLDLTLERYGLLKRARERIEDVVGIKFVYADINCQLKACTGNGQHLKFDSILELETIISGINIVRQLIVRADKIN